MAAAVLLSAGVGFWALLPRPLFRQPFSTLLLARDGSLLGAHIAADGQWRFPELVHVPERFARALIAFEDRRYYRHPGIDPLAVGRALRLNWQRGRVVSGASTLTMQLARVIHTQDPGQAVAPRSLTRKLYEALLALRLECSYSKDELLAIYASHAPFGGNVVGLEAAAWRYFGRPPDALSWAEAATLAVLPNAPALVTPGRNRARLLARRDALLRRLAEQQFIDALQLRLALAEPLVAEPRDLPNAAPHLLDTLMRQHPRQHRLYTTLDPALQQRATELVAQQSAELQARGIGNVAALIVDNQSFEVLAYVGNSAGPMDARRAGAVDILQRPRSSGSILKPFLYAAMLDSGQLLPTMLVPDVPSQFRNFAPENFDHQYRGAVPADVALAQSLNVPAVRLLRDYGYAHFYDLLRNLGFGTLSEPADHYGLALILGGGEVSAWDVARAYGNLAALAREPAPATRLAYRDLTVVKAADRARTTRSGRAELSPGAAWLTLAALLEVTRPADEANWRSFASSRHIAWKTGTSWGLRDAWAAGNTSRYTVVVWAGNANGAGVAGLTGASAAAPLLFALHGALPAAEWFARPRQALRRVNVCADDGYLATEACTASLQWAPIGSHFDQLSPHHPWLFLDSRASQQVNSQCERVEAMHRTAWFVLPPAQEHYYRRTHGDYHALPAWRRDCLQGGAAGTNGSPAMAFIYPNLSGEIYVPIDLDGQRGRVVFEVAHRDARARLYWHLDDRYLGATAGLNQLGTELAPGPHRLTVVDQDGASLTRRFEVLPDARGAPVGGAPRAAMAAAALSAP